MKKFIALFLVFSLLALSGNLYAKERHGAEVIVQKKDGQQLKGELIAVKENSLLLKESISGADEAVDINDVNVIKIMKKSKTLSGAVLGFLAGVSVGTLSGLIGWERYSWAPKDIEAKTRIVAAAGVIGGLVGVLIGGHIGTRKSRPESIKIEGKSDSEIKKILQKLRSKARIRDYK